MKHFNWADLLQRHPIFSNLDRKEIQWLLDDEVSEERTYPAGGTVVREGEVGDSLFLVGAGSVEAVLEQAEGPPIVLSHLKRGELFGEMAFLERRPRSATIRAREPSVLLEITGPQFQNLVDHHPNIEFRLLLKLSERLRNANEEILAIRLKGVDDKLKFFNEKLDSEHRLVDTSLKAALTMFEQTKVRTDEVITSAERSRGRQGWFFGFIATLVSIGTIFGLKEVVNLKQYAEDARAAVAEVAQAQALLRKAEPDLQQVERFARSFERFRTFVADYLQPDFRKALLSGDDSDIEAAYFKLKELHSDFALFLSDVELAMLRQPGRDYTGILQTIVRDAGAPPDRVKAYYLLLANAILVDRTQLGGGRKFDDVFAEFKRYVAQATPGPIKDDLSGLVNHFNARKSESPGKWERFQRVLELIPRG